MISTISILILSGVILLLIIYALRLLLYWKTCISNLIFDQIGDFVDEPDSTSRSVENGRIHRKYKRIHKAHEIACLIGLMNHDPSTKTMRVASEDEPEYDPDNPKERKIHIKFFEVDSMGFYYKDLASGSRIKFFWIVAWLRLGYFCTKSRLAIWLIYPAIVSLMAGYAGNAVYNGRLHAW